MRLYFDTTSVESYRKFLAVRRLPQYRIRGHWADVPDEYAHLLGHDPEVAESLTYEPNPACFDYQRDITQTAIAKRKYAIFADCGLGKTLMILDFAKHAARTGKPVLIVSPLMVVDQTIDEAAGFCPDTVLQKVGAADLNDWLITGSGIAVTNYEAIRDGMPQADLGGLILDESSMLKSHYGKWGTRLIEMGRGVEFKLCATGTPAPNDRIEFANHAVFLDRARTTNEFLATYFINRGQTQARWALKPHALRPFYKALSSWSIFLTNPATYGWSDNVGVTPPIHTHIHDVPLTAEQRAAAQQLTGQLLTNEVGGIAQRGKLSQIAKGKNGISTNKPGYIRELIESWPDESTIIWCHYNDEQEMMARTFPDAANVTGSTKHEDRVEAIRAFKAGEKRILVSKPKIMGFGLNLQVCTRQVFSGIKDSYEEFYQAVKRSNRIGSTKPLNVHVPVTELERPFIDNVLRKAKRVEADTVEQEQLFREMSI